MPWNRREFIKTAATGLAVIGTGHLMSACSHNLTRTDLNSESSELVSGLNREAVDILHYASLAPSGHNSQPWTVDIISPREWIIQADPARRLPAVDPDNRELLLSIGAFIENLVLAAGSLGFVAEVEILARSHSDTDLARINLQPAPPTGYPLTRLTSRMTPKHGYQASELKKQDLAVLTAATEKGLFYFPRDSKHGKCIEEGTVENFKRQTARAVAQEEMTRWVRISAADVRRHRDGLTLAGMEITGLAGWFVRSFSAPADFASDSFKKKSIEATTTLAGQGAGWLILTSPGYGVDQIINAGRRFERMALLARELGLGLHPMTQYLEEPEGQKELMANHRSDIVPQFILRVGYLSPYPDPVSVRRPVSWFTRFRAST